MIHRGEIKSPAVVAGALTKFRIWAILNIEKGAATSG